VSRRKSGGHPARARFASEVRTWGLVLLDERQDDEMIMHGTAALWVSAHGRVFTHPGGPLPDSVQKGRRGKCFANAQATAHEAGLRYVEGFAGPSRAGPWTLHAWNADQRGRVIDPTWGDDPGRAGRYLGVEFDRLPEGEQAGISLLTDLIGGKLVDLDYRTGRVRLHDASGDLAAMVEAQGGVAYRVRGDS
jgi:hypothetical protein